MTDTPYYTRKALAAIIMSVVLLVSIVAPAAALYDPATDGDVDPAANPDFPQLCAVDVYLLIDTSASTEGDLPAYKQAAKNFAAQLPDGSHLGLIEFNETANTRLVLTPVASDLATINSTIDALQSRTGESNTNWEAPLLEATQEFGPADANKPADLVILLSDGEPNAYGYPLLEGLDAGSTAVDDPLEAATLAGNEVKEEGTRVVGIGAGVTSADAIDAYENTTGPTQYDGVVSPQEADFFLPDDTLAGVDSVFQLIADEIDCGITVEKVNDANGDSTFSDLETAPAPGDAVTYQVTVTNVGNIDLTVSDFEDDVYTGLTDGNLSSSILGAALPAGDSIVFTFEGEAPGENGEKTNTFNVTAVDADGYAVSDEDPTTVQSPDLQPVISVSKLNDANADGTFSDDETAANPGDAVTYQVTVTNTGPNNVTIDAFEDDIYTGLVDADLSQSLVGAALEPGDSIVVAFDGSVPDAEETAKTNTFNVTASDDDGDIAQAEDPTTVRSPDLTPVISVVKSVDADNDGVYQNSETADNPGDTVSYEVVVTNDGPNDVTIDAFSDDVYTGLTDGDLSPGLVGETLAPGENITVYFDGTAPAAEQDSKTNTFNVTASDADGDIAQAEDDATVNSPDLTPIISVVKSIDADGDGTYSDSETAPTLGASVSYEVVVSNDGPNTVTIDAFSDDVYTSLTDGDLNQSLVGAALAPGESITVTFDGTAPTDELGSKTNTFNVTASDDDGDEVSDEDDATVLGPDLTPVISVVKTVDADGDGDYANSETADAPGDTVTYEVVVSNDGPNDVTVDSWNDSVYTSLTDADLSQQLTGETIVSGGSITVYFDGTAPAGEEDSKTNTFTVNASDADGDAVSDSDDATVAAPDLTPVISVSKLNDANADGTFADDETAPNPGDAVTYQVTVTNDGPNDVTIDSFGDDVYTGLTDADLDQALTGVVLAPGESITVTFAGSVPDAEETAKTNTFNVTASDDDGDIAQAEDPTTVRSPDLTPVISVVKSVDAQGDGIYADSEEATNPEDDVTYLIVVTNDGPNNVTIDSYVDDIYGTPVLNESLVGTVLEPGDSIAVTFDGTAPLDFGGEKTNTFNVSASDGDGDVVADEDTATVTTPDAVGVCARTPGFWSTHNGEYATGNNFDATGELMPVALGDGSAKSVIVDSDDVANDIFETQLTGDSHKSNGISKLYVHLLAAKFNTDNGVIAPDEVLDAIERSDEILTDYDESDWDDIKKNDKELAQEIDDLKNLLDSFNNGHFDGEGCIGDWWQEDGYMDEPVDQLVTIDSGSVENDDSRSVSVEDDESASASISYSDSGRPDTPGAHGRDNAAQAQARA